MIDLHAFFFYLLGATSILYLLHLGFYLIGANFYDIWQQQRLHHLHKNANTPYMPRITVLVPAHNEEKVIARCLDSVFASTYPSLDVIVVNDASTDRTRALLARYVRRRPDVPLRVINRLTNVGKGGALNYALKHYVTSELVMTLDADSTISPRTVERAVSYFTSPSIVGVAANVQIKNEHTTLSILQKFEHLIGYRAKKAYSLTNCEFVIGGVASTYRLNAIRAVGFYDTDTMTEDISLSMKIVARGNKANRIIYAADVMAMTEPVENLRALLRQRFRWKYGSLQNIYKHRDLIGSNDNKYSAMLTIYRLPMAVMTEVTLLLLPLVWAYAVYLTLSEKSLLLVAGAYFTGTIYMFLTLWFDEHLGRLERLYLTLYVPIAYFIFYIMDAVQVVAAVKCLVKLHSIHRLKHIGSTWISPPRLGGHMPVGAIQSDISLAGKGNE